MTNEEFDDFVANCYQELVSKQDILLKNYNLGAYDSYWFNQIAGTIEFKNMGEVKLEFAVIEVGSWSSKSNSWMWAWANNSLIEEFKAKSLCFKDLYNKTGINIFNERGFQVDEYMAHELTAMAIHHINALGMYIVPTNDLKIFFALVELK